MDTVTTAPMAIALAQLGGIGVVHRFLSVEDEVAEVTRVKRFRTRVISDPHTIAPGREPRRGARRDRAPRRLRAARRGRRRAPRRHPHDARPARGRRQRHAVAEQMTPLERLVTGEPGITPADALALLHEHRIEKLPLADAEGRVAGMVTLRDLEQEARFPQATRDGEGRLRVAAAIGVRGGYLERAEALLAADADALVLDIAHGHADSALEAVRELKRRFPEAEVIAGNVATAEARARPRRGRAPMPIKVGIGPGFACTTRLVAGVGVPQLTAVLDCARGRARDRRPADRRRRHPPAGRPRQGDRRGREQRDGRQPAGRAQREPGRRRAPARPALQGLPRHGLAQRGERAARDRGPRRRARPVRARGRGDGVPAARARSARSSPSSSAACAAA